MFKKLGTDVGVFQVLALIIPLSHLIMSSLPSLLYLSLLISYLSLCPRALLRSSLTQIEDGIWLSPGVNSCSTLDLTPKCSVDIG